MQVVLGLRVWRGALLRIREARVFGTPGFRVC